MVLEGEAQNAEGEVGGEEVQVQEGDTAKTSHEVIITCQEVLRLRGGGNEQSSSDDEEQKIVPPPSKKLKRLEKVCKGGPDQPLPGSCFEKSC